MALHNLVPSMFMSTAEKYAELKHVRASEVSQLLPVVLELVEERVGRFAKEGHIVHVVNVDNFETVLRYSLQAMSLFEDHVRSELFFGGQRHFRSSAPCDAQFPRRLPALGRYGNE